MSVTENGSGGRSVCLYVYEVPSFPVTVLGRGSVRRHLDIFLDHPFDRSSVFLIPTGTTDPQNGLG